MSNLKEKSLASLERGREGGGREGERGREEERGRERKSSV